MNVVTVTFTPAAKKHFLEAVAYIKRDKPDAARRFRHKVEGTLRRLSDFPESGRTIPEFPNLDFREVIVQPYRFFYKTTGTGVWIVAVWHSAQIPAEPMQ